MSGFSGYVWLLILGQFRKG